MAPEQTLDATQVDGRSDLYAMGCVLYFALTGKPPFAGGTIKDKINAHRHQEPDPIQWRNQDIPDQFAEVIHKLMAKKPEARYPSADAARAGLLAWFPKEAMEPVEQEGDYSQQAAARNLEAAPLSTEVLTANPLPFEQEPVVAPDLPADFFLDKSKSDIWAIALGVAAFWTLMILVLLVVLIFR